MPPAQVVFIQKLVACKITFVHENFTKNLFSISKSRADYLIKNNLMDMECFSGKSIEGQLFSISNLIEFNGMLFLFEMK